MPGPINGFWSSDCPERGPTLTHAHWRECDPQTGHPGTGEKHQWAQCCHCEHTAETWQHEQEADPELPPDDRPLALPQGDACIFGRHIATIKTPLVGDDGAEWQTCPSCHVQKEPELATGKLVGPLYGPGRGWITPRMWKRWEAVAYRLQGKH